ncbi:MAG: gamma-glutamyltransferase family protein [Phycisphaerae bacterium]
MSSILACSIALALLLLPTFALGGDRPAGAPFATRSEVLARHGMAATSQPLATQIALDILKRGGSAVDAAIAANAALGLMEPTGCGVGGDLFAIVWPPGATRPVGLNASGRAPCAITLDAFRERGLTQIPETGPLPVTVPGCVDGWITLHARFGKLPLTEVLAPAIKAARDGFPVSEVIAAGWQRGASSLFNQPGFASTFMPDGRAPRKGDIFRNPALAQTLEAIARGGRDAFYGGAIAQRIDDFCRREGCFLRKEDLARHTSTWVEPISTRYRGYDVWELGPNTQGLAALQMLNMLESYDLRALGHNSADYLHLLVETKKVVFEDRARMYADPAYFDVDLARLNSADYARRRRALIQPDRAADSYPAGDATLQAADARLQSGDTIYLTVADESRCFVSLIQSNYGGFGAGLCPDELGFGLQNRGALFSLDPHHPNCLAPGKRPFHTIIPAFVSRDERPFLSFGVMGGDMQPQGHVQVLCNILDFGMNLQEAGDAARFYHTLSSEPTGTQMKDGGVLALESAITDQIRLELIRRGHRVEPRPGAFGGFQAIGYDAERDVLIGASESRKDGQAAGY